MAMCRRVFSLSPSAVAMMELIRIVAICSILCRIEASTHSGSFFPCALIDVSACATARWAQ